MAFFNPKKTKYLKYINWILKLFYKPMKKEEINNKKIGNILVLAFLLIGDSIIYLPALRVIRKNYPLAKITLTGGSIVKEILKNQSVFDDFIETECIWINKTKNPVKVIKFLYSLKKINKKTYDLSIDFRGDWRNIFFMSFIKSTRKVSYSHMGGDYMLSHPFKSDFNQAHFIEEYLSLLQKIGCRFNANDYYPELLLSEHQKKMAQAFLTEEVKTSFLIGIHPGASLPIKQLDYSIYAGIIEKINIAVSNAYFIIFEGPNESEITSNVTLALHPNITYKVISLPLRDYISYVSCCDIMICNDSGASHIAAALNIPIVVIYTNVDHKYVKPYSQNIVSVISKTLPCKPCFQDKCSLNTEECRISITTEEISNAAIDVIDQIKLRK